MSRVVILVPRRVGRPDRDRLWGFTRARWAEHFPDWPIVEGHHDAEEGPFNRSAALNRAADLAGEWDAAILIDADVLIDPNAAREAVERALETNGPVLAYHERGQLTQQGTDRILGGYRGNWRPLVKVQSSYGGFLYDSCSSAVAVSRKLWDAVGGFDECFIGWGWEDVAFRIACETISGAELVKVHSTAWHLWHRVSNGNNAAEPTFIANRARGDRYKAARWDAAALAPLLEEAAQARIPAAASSERIPRILHRTVPAETDDEVERYWQRFADLHAGWDLRTWRDPLDPAEWPITSAAWDLCESGAQRAGLIRLEALLRDGGIYVDSDVEPYRSFEPLLRLSAFAAWEDPSTVPDAVIGATRGHPAIREALTLALARLKTPSTDWRTGSGSWSTGPGVITTVFPDRSDVLLFPPGAFYPYHYSEKDRRRREDHATAQPWCFAAHHWRASWLPQSP